MHNLLTMGEFDTEGMTLLPKMIFITALVFNLIIMMNLLISIIGDTFGRVQEQKDVVEAQSLLDLFRDLEIYMVFNRNKSSMKYIQVCKKKTCKEMGGVED